MKLFEKSKPIWVFEKSELFFQGHKLYFEKNVKLRLN